MSSSFVLFSDAKAAEDFLDDIACPDFSCQLADERNRFADFFGIIFLRIALVKESLAGDKAIQDILKKELLPQMDDNLFLLGLIRGKMFMDYLF
jgi:hypothetical protein